VSPYEILAVALLVAAGGFAYRLYRSDTKPGAPKPPPGAGESMFGRDRKDKSA
jgi:hypothetical protein